MAWKFGAWEELSIFSRTTVIERVLRGTQGGQWYTSLSSLSCLQHYYSTRRIHPVQSHLYTFFPPNDHETDPIAWSCATPWRPQIAI